MRSTMVSYVVSGVPRHGPSDDYEWPDLEHGITVDYQNHVWISGSNPIPSSGAPRSDDMLLKFTRDGTLVRQIGRRDGSGGNNYSNSHVTIVERETLAVVGSFGARSAAPGDFAGIHNLAVDSQGNLYTAESDPNNRAQKFVFQ